MVPTLAGRILTRVVIGTRGGFLHGENGKAGGERNEPGSARRLYQLRTPKGLSKRANDFGPPEEGRLFLATGAGKDSYRILAVIVYRIKAYAIPKTGLKPARG
jgi:hypothetical protein